MFNPMVLKAMPIVMDALLKTPVSQLSAQVVQTWISSLPLKMIPTAPGTIADALKEIAIDAKLVNVGSILSNPRALSNLVPKILEWKNTLVVAAPPTELTVRCAKCNFLNVLIDGQRADHLE